MFDKIAFFSRVITVSYGIKKQVSIFYFVRLEGKILYQSTSFVHKIHVIDEKAGPNIYR